MPHARPSIDLRSLAVRAMRERGFLAEFPPEALSEAASFRAPGRPAGRDLRAMPWSSIDNDDSRDLDQLEAAEQVDGAIRIYVGIAGVDEAMRRHGPLEQAAEHNTTSVYTAAGTFPMLPPRLSEDLTSLWPDQPREAMVTEYDVAPDGRILRSEHYPALVESHARLTYNGVSAWLDGKGPPPAPIAARPELREQVELQERAALALRRRRLERGALQIERAETRAVRDEQGDVVDVTAVTQTRAGAIIEDLMVAANERVAAYLDRVGSVSLRRAVREPERWPQIVALAASYGQSLPPAPSAPALATFLREGRAHLDAEEFDRLSLAVVKLVGRGVYLVKRPGEPPPFHFGLAAPDYVHSTAPNRRYPDVIIQRLLRAALSSAPSPYTLDELTALADRCSERESMAKKVERQVQKSAAAAVLEGRSGQTFSAIVTGASPKGTYARLRSPAVEGRIVQGERGLNVGDRLRVKLLGVDIERGFIDLAALDG